MSTTRYQDPVLLDQLSRSYVVGTLHGAARRRFEGLLRASPTARRAVREWEERLVPLAETVAPVDPPHNAWRNISSQLGIGTRQAPRPGNSRLWMGIAAAFACATLVLGLLQFGSSGSSLTADRIAIIADEATGPVWVVQSFSPAGELRTSVVNERPLPDDSDYELWMLPDDNSAPVSLGLLGRNTATLVALNTTQRATLAGTSTLAVSIEPAGGSLTGGPTGPVIYTAPLLST